MSAQRYRKKPVEIQAMRFETHADAEAIYDWVVDNGGKVVIPTGPLHILIPTLEGTMRADVGDWIIREAFPTDDRKFYPCKPEIFAATYEEA